MIIKEVINTYTLQDLAEALKVTRRTIYNYLKAGKIKTTKCGRFYRISEEEYKRILREGLH